MSATIQDLRHGLRVLRKNPRFTALAVLTLALGIGGSTAIFSVVEARLFRPLPFHEPEDLVWITQSDIAKGVDGLQMSVPNFLDLRAAAASFEQTAASRGDDKTVLLADGSAIRVQFLLATPEVFPMLAVAAAEGRVFNGQDGPGVALVSERFRQAHFGPNDAVIGQTLATGDASYEIVGVLPGGLVFPPGPAEAAADIWTPLDVDAPRWKARRATRLYGYGRLREGVALPQARTELSAIASRLSGVYPDTNANVGFSARPLRELGFDALRRESPVLLGAVGFVLLIGCINIANLLLSRLTARRGEMAVRIALGASRGRLVRQLLAESFVLAGAGWVVGLPLAYWGVRTLAAMTPPMTAIVGEIEIDGRVLSFSMLATLLSALFFGALPALAAPTRTLSGSIRSDGRSLVGGRSRLRSALIAAEISLSLVSLVAAGLMLRSVANAVLDPAGFNPEKLLSFRTTSSTPSTFYPELAERLAALPGVEAVAFANRLPLPAGGGEEMSFDIAGDPAGPSAEPRSVNYRMTSPGYFQVMQSPVLEGRDFSPRDDASAPRVAIVNRAFVQRFLGPGPALGKKLLLRGAFGDQTSAPPVEIVGVAAGEKYWRLDAPPLPEIYAPFAQSPASTVEFAVRTEGDPRTLAEAVRAEVRALDPTRPLSAIRLMEQRMDAVLAAPKFSTALLALFAALGLGLAAVGVFGVTAQAVAERGRELGLRSALGASPRQLQRLVLAGGTRTVAVGLGAGLGCSLAVSQLLRGLYDFRGVSPRDPAVYVLAAATLLGAALLACYLPARRAARIDPMEALRND